MSHSSPIACLGEPLALVAHADLDAAAPTMRVGGAEANVATGLAAVGTRASFIGRVGPDAEGKCIVEHLRAHDVCVRALEIAPSGFTGRYAKTEGLNDSGEPVTTSTYRRTGSAAAQMDTTFLHSPTVARAVSDASIVHTTGITVALSESCAELVATLFREANVSGVRTTFDINWREQLWPQGDPALVVDLARRADVVLVGADEAERVLGEFDPARVRELLPEPSTVIVKDGATRAVAIDRSGAQVSVPALAVEVVEPVGAGDSFAAGFLHGLAKGEDPRMCLRRGHIGAAATLTSRADVATFPTDTLAALLAASDDDWAHARVAPSGVEIGGARFAPPRGIE